MPAQVAGLTDYVRDWQRSLRLDPDEEAEVALRRHERASRPLGSYDFITRTEHILSRPVRKRRAGRKPQARAFEWTGEK